MDKIPAFLLLDDAAKTLEEDFHQHFAKRRRLILSVQETVLNECFEPEDRNRIAGFANAVLQQYREDEFRMFFRMSKESAREVVTEVGRVVADRDIRYLTPREIPGGRAEISLETKVLMFLWYMASSSTYRQIATLFGVTESTALHSVQALIRLTSEHLMDRFITWPSREEAAEISNMYEEMNGFPGVIGHIDGTHIPISKPTERAQDYYNRKDFFSIQLQGVVREDLRFINIYTGWPGKVHDARVFASSPLAETGARLCANGHLLGDAAYPCYSWLLTPFRRPRVNDFTRVESNYNRILSSMRVTVERAFGLLKGRFKRLRPLVQSSVSLMNDTITAACVLHNICILSSDDTRLEEYLQDDNVALNAERQAPQEVQDAIFNGDNRQRGNLKRLQIARTLDH